MFARLVSHSVATLLLVPAANSFAADAAAGKAIVEATCAQCHEAADWEGETADSLSAMIHGVVSGKTKHKIELKLTETQIADVAAYWSQATQK